METTEQKIIAKQKELIKHLGKLVLASGYEIIEHNSKWMRLRDELSDLVQQLSKERKQGDDDFIANDARMDL